jgi:serine/threonine-protein kinase
MTASVATSAGPSGRYAIYDEIAAGGMATVHLGRLLGPVGFGRTVAIKRLHPHLAREPEALTMFLDEARLAARIRHPNVVPTLDIVTTSGGPPFLVMEYVQGESLARLLASVRAKRQRVPVPVAASIVVGMLHGLQAAHEARGERGESLGIIHRDVSPQNVIVGQDGVARLLDFGVAKAAGRLQTTREGRFKGKLAYTAPEIMRGGKAAPTADIYSAAVVFWEVLAGVRLFEGESDASVIERVLFAGVPAPSHRAGHVPAGLDQVVLRALARDPARRFATAREMARAIESVFPIASRPEVGEWVEALAGEELAKRAQAVASIERGTAVPLALDSLKSSGQRLADRSTPVTDDTTSNEVEVPSAERRPSRGALWGVLVTCALVAAATVAAARLRNAGGKSTGFDRAAPGSAFASPSAPPPTQVALPAAVDPTTMATGESSPVDKPASPSSFPSPSPSAVRSHPKSVNKAPSKDASLHKPPVAPSAATKPAGKSACDPPWNLDAQGIKQYKVECL